MGIGEKDSVQVFKLKVWARGVGDGGGGVGSQRDGDLVYSVLEVESAFGVPAAVCGLLVIVQKTQLEIIENDHIPGRAQRIPV